ncbi:hypothetical protein [Stakelama marina]|uniref:Uncharacterized protein n=1 Tax=Stakelama marina TaxID=2826939 RepID=A0A8T4IBM2_9SPHN|nr:hypothetical protein [Stakelama marina]MBR0551502.1 hypothetical protein [Stakelama marina]
MAEEKTPATPIKEGPGSATPSSTATAPKAPRASPKPAAPVKDGAGKAKNAKEVIKEEAGKASRQAGDKARGYAEQGKEKATGALDEAAKVIKDAAGSVDDKFGSEYGRYAHSAAGSVSDLADRLRDADVDDLLEEARQFVRKSPAIALGAAAAVGFIFARILKSGIDSDTSI